MAFDLSKIGTSVDGHFYSAPKGSTLPTAIGQELPAGTLDHGYASQDGFGIADSVTDDQYYAWQKNQLVDSGVTAAYRDYSIALLEDNEDNRELFYGGPAVAGAYAWDPAYFGDHRVFFFLTVSSKGITTLYILEDGGVVGREDLTHNSSTLFSYGLSIRDYSVGGTKVLKDDVTPAS